LEGVETAVGRAFHLQDTASLITKGTLETNFRSERNIIEFNNYLYGGLPSRLQATINEQVRGAMDDDSYQKNWVDSGLHDMITRAYEGAEQAVPLSKQEAAGGWVDVAFLDADSLDTDDVRRKGGLLTMPEFRELACRRTFAQVEDWLRQGVY